MGKRILLQTIDPVVLVKNIKGVSKKSNKPYHFIDIANRETYENITLNVDVTKKIVDFESGEVVRLVLGLTRYGNDAQMVVEDILPAD